VHSTRPVSRGSTAPLRAIIAAVLAFGLVLAIATSSWAAPVVTINSGPPAQTRETLPSFDFAVDASALTVDCSLDQGIEAYAPCTSPYTAASSLGDGDWTFRVRASDGVDETVETWSFTVDTAPPSLSIDSAPTGATNDRTPSFAFTTDAPTVECSVDQGTEAFVPCSSPYTPAALGDGSYTFRVRATDAAGNERELTQSFTVDATPPSLSIDSGPSGLTNDSTPSFGFTVAGATTVECSIDQGTSDYAPCTSPYAPVAPLLDGSYTFRVRARDAAGNQTTVLRAFSVDATPPSVSIDSGPSGPTNDRTPSFGFTVTGASSVECSIDQGTPAYRGCTTGSSHTSAVLADGSYTFRVRATDAAGNARLLTRSFSVDATPPSLSIDSGPSGLTNRATPSFGFTAGSDATTVECSIDQGTSDYAPCTSPYTPAALGDGSYTFRVRAVDALGNAVTLTRSFSVDATPPSLSIDSGPSGLTNRTTATFGFTVSGATRVECSVDQGTETYGGCTSGGSHTATGLADGSYTFRVRATDAAGNARVLTRSFSVDATPPSLSIDSGPSGPTNDTTPSFDFTVTGATTIECSIDQGGEAYASCSGVGTHRPAAALPDGDYTFRVRARDAAGNVTTRTRDFSVDREAPSLSIDSGPRGPTNDTMPSFGFTAEPGARVECSIDQGTPTYRPCTTATSYKASPLAQGSYVFHVRATDEVGNPAETFRAFTVDTTPPSLTIDSGPLGTTIDSTPPFGFTAEAGATVECSIDQGAPAYGPCASTKGHVSVVPLADGTYTFRVRATDRAGNQTIATRVFTVDTVPETPGPESPRTDPTPPVTAAVTPRPAPAKPQLLSPFPLVRISGTLTSTGARIRLLTVRAAPGTLVRVTVSPGCRGKRRSSRRCRVVQAAGTVGRRAVIGFRGLEHTYRSGTVIVVRVWRADRIGKYTRFTIVRGKAPRRVDQCLVPEATSGSRCPTD
jgi:hypothetical protein